MSLDSHDLLMTLDSLGKPRVLVLGDLMLDRYTFGDAERVSQEAPVLVLKADAQETRLGGAASVCQLLRGLEAQVTCVGVVGGDADGRELRTMLTEAGVDHQGVLDDHDRPSTVKHRYIGRAQNRHPHQILRVDREVRDEICPEIERELLHRVTHLLASHQVLLVSDYGKGVCSPSLLKAVFAAAELAGVPVLVDPIKISDYSKYKGATAVTPNRLETETATGIKIVEIKDAQRAGFQLCQQLGLKAAIITLDRDGIALVPPDGGGVVYPTRPRSVYDITGAGDMVLATLGVCVAAHKSLVAAVQLANVAGGLEVEKVGVVPVSRGEIRGDLLEHGKAASGKVVTAEQAARLVDSHKRRGQRVVFTNGCFDLLHVGHITYLEQAARMGDVLVVGLNSDSSVRDLKGPTRPVLREADRASLLAALSVIDYVVVFDADTPLKLIQQLRPDVLVKGGDYRPADIVGREVVEAYGGQVFVTSKVDGVSTTQILNVVAANRGLQPPHFAPTSVAAKIA